ncbi:MAG: ABC transporter ATP-binding protein [Geminicoccaceae bacterium]
MIELDALSVTFGEGAKTVRAVDLVSFTVARGSAFGLVGESGSGKSTVLRAIAGLIPGWSGRISVDGEALGRSRSRAERRKLQMVFQDPYGSLHPRHTIDRILSEPCRIQGLDRPARRVEAALEEVGLSPAFRYRYPHQLSGGQRQRVAIARALIVEPEIVLLDEPTSALDVSVQAEILNLLVDLRQRRGLTYLFVSHNLAVVGHVCGELAVMRQGRIVEAATAADLVAGTLEHPYSRQLLASSKGYSREAARVASASGLG